MTPGEDAEGRKTPAAPSGSYRESAPFLSLGFQLASAVLILFFLGRWADGAWGTGPYLQLAGVLVGCGGGLLKFFMAVQAMNNRPDRKENP
jgi:hypothetical protein